MRALTKSVLVLQVLAILASGASAGVISLDAAIQSALQNNEKVRQYQERLQEKVHDDREATGNFLPSVKLQASYNHLNSAMAIDLDPIRQAMIQLQARNQTEFANVYQVLQGNAPLTPEQRAALYGQYTAQLDGAIPAFVDTFKQQNYPSASLTAVQPLFLGGKLLAAKRYSAAERQAAGMELRKISDEVMRDVVTGYVGLVLLDEVIATRQDVLAGMKQHEEDAKRLFEEGLIAKYQLLRAEVAVADADRNLFDDLNRLELAQISFCHLIGLADTATITVQDSLIYRPIANTLEYFKKAALEGQPLLAMIAAKRTAASQKYVSERADYFPQIAAYGRYELFPSYLSSLEPRWAVGIQANWSLFDGFKRDQRMQSSRHLNQELRYLEAGTRRQVDLWVQKAYRDVQNSAERFNKLGASVELAQENLKFCDKRFQSGLGTSLEVVDSRLVLERNQIERLSSLYDYYRAVADLYLACGQPLDIVELWNGKDSIR